MTVDEFADIINLADVVKRHKDSVTFVTQWNKETGFLEIDIETPDDILDDYWRDPTDAVMCQRICLRDIGYRYDAGYRYCVSCPAWMIESLRGILTEDEW